MDNIATYYVDGIELAGVEFDHEMRHEALDLAERLIKRRIKMVVEFWPGAVCFIGVLPGDAEVMQEWLDEQAEVW